MENLSDWAKTEIAALKDKKANGEVITPSWSSLGSIDILEYIERIIKLEDMMMSKNNYTKEQHKKLFMIFAWAKTIEADIEVKKYLHENYTYKMEIYHKTPLVDWYLSSSSFSDDINKLIEEYDRIKNGDDENYKIKFIILENERG